MDYPLPPAIFHFLIFCDRDHIIFHINSFINKAIEISASQIKVFFYGADKKKKVWGGISLKKFKLRSGCIPRANKAERRGEKFMKRFISILSMALMVMALALVSGCGGGGSTAASSGGSSVATVVNGSAK